MALSQWLRSLFALETKKPFRSPLSRRSSFRPMVEHLEHRLAPANNITIVIGAAGTGNLDTLFAANHGTILTTDDPGDNAATLSVGALAANGAAFGINVAAVNTLHFNDIGTLNLLTGSSLTAAFSTTTGTLDFANTANVVATAGAGLTFSAGGSLTVGGLNTGGGDVQLTAGTAGAGNLAFGNILTNGAGNLTFQATNAAGGAITQNSGSAVGLVINATATDNVTVNALSGTTVNLTSNTGSVTSAGATAVQATGTLTVGSATGITLNTSAADLAASNSTSGNVSVTQLGTPVQALTITGAGVINSASGGTVSVTNLGAGITVNNGSPVQSDNGGVTLSATDLQLNDAVSSGTARTILDSSVGGRAIDLGTNSPNTIGLTQAELNEVTAGILQIGSPVAGNINVSTPITNPATWNMLTLDNGGTVTEAAAGSLTAPNLRISSAGPVTLGSVNDVGTLAASTANALLFNNGANSLTVGTVDGVIGITTTNTNITLSADSMSLTKQVNAGTGTVTLEPSTSGQNIDLGTNPSAGNLGLKQSDLNQVTAGLLVIGSAGTGVINFSQNITDAGTGWTHLSLENGAAAITQTGGVLTAATLSVLSSGGVSLTGAGSNSVPTIAANIGGTGTFNYNSAVGVVVGTAAGPAGNIDGITTNAGSVTVNATTGDVSVDTIKGTTVDLTSVAGSVTSTGAAAVQASGTLTVDSATGINIFTVAAGLAANNSTSGNVIVTQLAVPVLALTITGAGVANNASGGTLSITNLGAGLTVNNGSPVQSNNAGVTLSATDLQLNGAVSSGTARTILDSSVAGRAIDLGTNTSGTVGLTQAELSEVTAGVLQIGSPVAGNINVSAAITNPANWNMLTLDNGGTVTEAAAGSLTAPNLRISSAGPVTLGSVNDVGTLAASTANALLFNNGANSLTVGTVDGVIGITTTNTNITLSADSLTLTQSVNAGAGTVTLEPGTAARPITLGTTVANTLSLLQAGLNKVTAGLLVIGNAADTGNISVAAPITSAGTGWTALSLITGGAIVEQNAATIAATKLALTSATGIGSATALQTNVANLAFLNSTSGAVQITNAQALTIASVGGLTTSKNSGGAATLVVTQGALTIGASLKTIGDLNASATGTTTPDITVNGGVTLESTAGNVILSAARSIDEIAGATIKSDTQAVCLNYSNANGALTLYGSVRGTAGAVKGAPVLANNKILPVASMVFTTQPSNAVASPSVMSKVVVTCYDRFGNIVPGASVSLKLQTGTMLTGATTVTANAQGQAAFTNLSVGQPGTYTFLATVVNTSGFTPSGVYQPTVAPKAVTQASAMFTISGNPATTRIRKR